MGFLCFAIWHQLIQTDFLNRYKHLKYFSFLKKFRIETYSSHWSSRIVNAVRFASGSISTINPDTNIYISKQRRGFIQSRSGWKTYTCTVIAARHIFVRLLYMHIISNRENYGGIKNLNYFAWRRITCSPFPTHILAGFGKCIVTLTTISQSYIPCSKAKHNSHMRFFYGSVLNITWLCKTLWLLKKQIQYFIRT